MIERELLEKQYERLLNAWETFPTIVPAGLPTQAVRIHSEARLAKMLHNIQFHGFPPSLELMAGILACEMAEYTRQHEQVVAYFETLTTGMEYDKPLLVEFLIQLMQATVALEKTIGML